MFDGDTLSDSLRVLPEAGIATWRWNVADDVLRFCDAGYRMLQVRDDELPLSLDTVFNQLIDDDLAGFQRAFAAMAEGDGVHSADFRAVLDDGVTRWYRALGRSFRDDGGQLTHAAGVLMDVTELRCAQEAHSSFFEQPNGLHLIADFDGRLRMVNSGWQITLGYAVDELTGRDWLDLVHDEDRATTRAEFANLSQGINSLYFENRIRHRSGHYRHIAWSAAVPGSQAAIHAIGNDFTEAHEARQHLAQAAAVFHSSGEGIVITDDSGGIRDVNQAFVDITGYSREEAIGAGTRLLRSGEHDQAFYARLWDSLKERGQWRGEIRNRRKNGEVCSQLVTITRIDGEYSGYVAILMDISQLRESQSRLLEMAHYDQLTRLPNRHLINERLQQCLHRAARHGLRLAVIFLDIDSFKNINDSLGHAVGDMLLKETADRLRGSLRQEDHIGRIGGDEFLLVVEDIATPDDVTRLAEKIIGALRAPLDLSGREITVTASLGISLYPDDGQSSDALMSNADAAMYSAKDQGRDTFRFYSQRMTRTAFRHVLLDSALREAISRDELRLAFQPQIALSGHRLTGLEVLLRWHHPHLGTVPPSQFIPHAERTGLIRSIGEWVLEQACRQGARWLADGIEFGTLGVNVSAPQFRDAQFADTVQRILADTGLPPRCLELEITESVLLRDTRELLHRMNELHELGVRFAIDDFGTGYSSLSYLRRMRIDRLKLDRSFVTDLVSDDNARIIAGAVIALGRALGISVIAEGIEQAAQEQLLTALGCDEAQGYLYSMPLYAEKIEPILRRRSLPAAGNFRARAPTPPGRIGQQHGGEEPGHEGPGCAP